jgi:tetratricopeptide (TPR) repeat protein
MFACYRYLKRKVPQQLKAAHKIVLSRSSIRRSGFNDPIVFTNRGDAYRDKGRFDRALQDYYAAIAINPKWVNAYFGRALTLQQKVASDFDAFVNEGRFEQLAIAEYGKGLQIAPRNAGALSNRGLLYHTLRNTTLPSLTSRKRSRLIPQIPSFCATAR